MAGRIGMISLGCPKSLVDSEKILTDLRVLGYDVVGSYAKADIVIVNTCGFLLSAQEESCQAIEEAMTENGRVIITGCLGKEKKFLEKRFPKALAITGPHAYEEVVQSVLTAQPPPAGASLRPADIDGTPVRLTPSHFAYFKISEGCSHQCSFCAIPSIRGPLTSVPLDTLLFRAESLVQGGLKELIVVAQDTAAYGWDLPQKDSSLKGSAAILNLCEALGRFGIWVRLHYLYPYPVVDRLVEMMADGKILPYLDIPLQHAHPDILRKMRRPAAGEKLLERIALWRKICPELTIRSSFITGFPSETEEHILYLLDWLEAAQLDRIGVFRYEAMPKTDAFKMEHPVDAASIEERYRRLMEQAQMISYRKLQKKIGRTVDVLFDGLDDDGIFIGRTKGDAPEVDGLVYLKDIPENTPPGTILKVFIEQADAYDLYGIPDSLRNTEYDPLVF